MLLISEELKKFIRAIDNGLHSTFRLVDPYWI